MASTDQTKTLRAAIADALSIGRKATDGFTPDSPNLYQMVLKGLAETANDHALAILHLSDGQHVRSSKILLRTLIENWIIAQYVAADDRGQRAAAYISLETRETKRFLDGLLRMAIETPSNQQAILASARLTSIKDLKRRIARQQADMDKAKRLGVPAFPNIVDCARKVGLELTYRQVYGYLLSAQVHARAGDTLSGLRVAAPDRADVYRVLITTLFVQVMMLILISERLGRPDRKSITRFETLLAKLRCP